jgi:hypothetical protein
MRTEMIEKKYYKFDELSEDAKQKAIEKLYDLNVDFDWWQFTYEDAENIGLKIKEFDLDRGSYVKGEFTDNAENVANKIIAKHGESCDTYQTAKNYLKDLSELTAKNLIDNVEEEYPEDFLDTEDLDKDFLRSLCEDYRTILQHEYDYQTSEAAILETIEANEYEFDEEGNLQ